MTTTRALLITLALPLILILLSTSCSRIDKTNGKGAANKLEVGVIVEPDASVRLDPLIYSARIAVLSTGDNVEIIDTSKERSRVGGKFDYWYKIRLRSGLTGWMYGSNMKIFSEGQDSSIASFAKELRTEEAKKIVKDLQGKWWSITGEDTFTDSILALRDNSTYVSGKKGAEKTTEGSFTIDPSNSNITFDKGTTFGNTINFIIRGEVYVLEAVTENRKIRFKKISNDPEYKKDVTQAQEADPKAKPSGQ